MKIPMVGGFDVRQYGESGLFVATHQRNLPNPFIGSRFVATMQTQEAWVKLFDVQFLKREVGLMVNMPYCTPSHAIVGQYALAVSPGGEQQQHLRDGGKLTERGIKLSFHKSGECLFSLTDQIQKIIRNQAKPLTSTAGHLFSIHVRGPQGFFATDDKNRKPPAKNRTTLTFNVEEAGQVGLKITGWWYRIGALRIKRVGPQLGNAPNPVHVETPVGRWRDGFLLAPPR